MVPHGTASPVQRASSGNRGSPARSGAYTPPVGRLPPP
uniref:Uncharacterized protein n=1 Tax=Siphoviridae sp. ct8Cp41 TaxID=2825358 RepID=A0A8S5UAZ6_9CAUD|nr:MAG TPA: hypothetical protein [Siphoviridae sp. ct8Cp41]